MPDDNPAWCALSEAERKAVQPFLLNVADLSERDYAAIRCGFIEAGINGVRAMAAAVQRVPTQAEIDLLRRALADHFNQRVIPPMRERDGATIQ